MQIWLIPLITFIKEDNSLMVARESVNIAMEIFVAANFHFFHQCIGENWWKLAATNISTS